MTFISRRDLLKRVAVVGAAAAATTRSAKPSRYVTAENARLKPSRHLSASRSRT